MSPQYPILDNRPINQWKVTELKEELRRRKLSIRGLKEDLVKRLAEAIHQERELEQEEELKNDDGLKSDPPDNFDGDKAEKIGVDAMMVSVNEGVCQDVVEHKHVNEDGLEGKLAHRTVDAANDDSIAADGQKLSAQLGSSGNYLKNVEQHKDSKPPAQDVKLESISVETVTSNVQNETNDSLNAENISSEPEARLEVVDPSSGIGSDLHQDADQDTYINPVPLGDVDNENSASSVDINEGSSDMKQEVKAKDGDTIVDTIRKGKLEEMICDVVNTEMNEADGQNPINQLQSGGNSSRYDEQDNTMKLLAEDVKRDLPQPNNQVYEVSQDLGYQIKCESISADSLTTNVNNEIKDYLNAGNVNLEPEIKTEIMHATSIEEHPIVGELRPVDDVQDLNTKPLPLGEVDDVKNVSNSEFSKKRDLMDEDSPEKLNLDRSSGDDSMEEDVMESKQVESSYNSGGLGERITGNKVQIAEAESLVDTASGFPLEEKGTIVEEKSEPTPIVEKRKLEDQQDVGRAQAKRQRRWNSETIKVPHVQLSHTTSPTRPKDAIQTPKRLLTRSESSCSADAPKERIVPPSQRAATTSLRIDRFLRPFTLNAVKELLGKTGTVCDFWMDQIKTHCYVTYSSLEEAVNTRNAVFNLQWPPNGGRHLVAEFVDPQEVKTHIEAPPQAPMPITETSSMRTAATAPLTQQPLATQPEACLPRDLSPPPSNPPPQAQPNILPGPPPPPKKPEPPILTLDDLFMKTKATPRIYYLPLTDEQVAAKIAAEKQNAPRK